MKDDETGTQNNCSAGCHYYTDDTFNFVVSIMYSQLFNLLCDKADDEYGGRLPIHVRFLLDEFANIGLIPKFEKLRDDPARWGKPAAALLGALMAQIDLGIAATSLSPCIS